MSWQAQINVHLTKATPICVNLPAFLDNVHYNITIMAHLSSPIFYYLNKNIEGSQKWGIGTKHIYEQIADPSSYLIFLSYPPPCMHLNLPCLHMEFKKK